MVSLNWVASIVSLEAVVVKAVKKMKMTMMMTMLDSHRLCWSDEDCHLLVRKEQNVVPPTGAEWC
jgi:hypothetical protein